MSDKVVKGTLSANPSTGIVTVKPYETGFTVGKNIYLSLQRLMQAVGANPHFHSWNSPCPLCNALMHAQEQIVEYRDILNG